MGLDLRPDTIQKVPASQYRVPTTRQRVLAAHILQVPRQHYHSLTSHSTLLPLRQSHLPLPLSRSTMLYLFQSLPHCQYRSSTLAKHLPQNPPSLSPSCSPSQRHTSFSEATPAFWLPATLLDFPAPKQCTSLVEQFLELTSAFDQLWIQGIPAGLDCSHPGHVGLGVKTR